MNLSEIDECLLSNQGASKAFHEKWGWMVYWVGGKQFACEFQAKTTAKLPYAGKHLLSLKCDPERIIELRSEYPESIFPGYYSDGRTWITIDLDADLPEDIVLALCIRSCELVFEALPKKMKQEILIG